MHAGPISVQISISRFVDPALGMMVKTPFRNVNTPRWPANGLEDWGFMSKQICGQKNTASAIYPVEEISCEKPNKFTLSTCSNLWSCSSMTCDALKGRDK